jgi:hypothetical protein
MPTEEEKDLNTEANYIAGNPLGGPASNTAARPGPAMGMPSATGHSANSTGRPDPADLAEIQESQPTEIPDPNFNKSTRDVYNDQSHNDNQASSADRGEFGVQGALGTTHGGFGNQFREGVTEHGGLDRKYYGEGVVRPDSGDVNAYRNYDGHDERPDVQASPIEEAAVVDTPPARPVFAHQPTDGRGNEFDNRNLPDRADAAAAHQNDNGSVETVGAGYAPDYGHTSGVGLPRGTSQPLETPPAAGRNQSEDQRSSRGGYDNQGSAGGEHRESAGQPGTGSAPAPSGPDTPHATQGEGYGYGHQRSEQPKPADIHTGADRQGSTPGTQLATHGSDTTQGYGSKGGSYDDKNPGARPDADQQAHPADTTASKTDSDTDYGSAPRRNAGRDDEQAAE